MTGPATLTDEELGEIERARNDAPECPIKDLMDWSTTVCNKGVAFYKAARKAMPALIVMARRTAEAEAERDRACEQNDHLTNLCNMRQARLCVVEAERDKWKKIAERADVCMTCEGGIP